MARKQTVAEIVREKYRDKNSWTEATWNVEFKSGNGGLPKSLWETYSAFANTSGGIIIVGVGNDGKVEGITTAAQYRDEFSNILSSGTKCSCVMSGERDIAVVELDGKEVLAIRVNAATPSQKPVYLDRNQTKCFIRVGEADRQCKSEELSRMLRDKDVITSDYSADANIIPHSSTRDLDTQTIQAYKRDLRRNRENHPWAELDDEELMIKLGAYRCDRERGEWGLTLAGLLMFGRAETIRELHPIYRIDYFELDGSEGSDAGTRWADRITSDGTWEPNLYQFFFRVLPKLTENLKRPFRLSDKLTRKDDSTAYEAVREALANAIIHADYREPGGVVITKKPSGLVLENAGTLLMSKDEVYAGGISVCRNKNLQTMFKLIGIVEEAGSGVDVLMNGWTRNFFCLPQLTEDIVGHKVVWELPYLAMVDRNVMYVQQEFLGYEKYARLTAEEKIMLMMIPADGYVSNQDLRLYMPQLHPVDLGKRLAHLREEGYLCSKGRSSATKYGLVDKLAEQIRVHSTSGNPGLNDAGNSGLNGEKNSLLNSGLSRRDESDEKNVNDELSDDNDTSSFLVSDHDTLQGSLLNTGEGSLLSAKGGDNSALSRTMQELNLPEDLKLAVEEYRKKARHVRETTDQLIVKLCIGRQISLSQLSILLNRVSEPLRRDVVAPLVRHGKLKRTMMSDNDPDQAYTAVLADGESSDEGR